MTAAKHTPGPWQVTGPSGKVYLIVRGASGQHVALILTGSRDEEADACLIAAAPCLLEALQSGLSLLECHETDAVNGEPQAMLDARAAIAKATGEGA